MDEDRDNGRISSTTIRRMAAYKHAKRMIPIIGQARRERASTYQELADWLNAKEHWTRRGKPWSKKTVWDLLHIDISQIAEANSQADRALQEMDRTLERLLPKDRKAMESALLVERGKVTRRREELISEAKDTGRKLRGD